MLGFVVDDQTLLDLVDAQISALLSGGGVQRWSEGGHAVEHMSLTELYKFKQQLETRLAQASLPMCLPIVSRDI
jgi:hypothetical protein